MQGLILIGVLALLLFMTSYFTKRRYGVMGMALIAGQALIILWENSITKITATIGMPSIGAFSGVTIVTLIILFTPSILLFFGGPKYSKKTGRIIGSLLATLVAIVLMSEILRSSLLLLGDDKMVFDLISQYRTPILSIAIISAIFDMMAVHNSKLIPSKKGDA